MQTPDLPHGDPLLQHEGAEQERGNHVLDALVHVAIGLRQARLLKAMNNRCGA